ncbi:MAG: thioredoxin [Pyrinomonadaceae bacterium]|nr:thioredoxin [Pyrinomonadaceae bacterium]
MSDSIKSIGDADFKTKITGSEKAVLVNFWANWSAPSKMMMPSLEAVAAECREVAVYKLDTDQNASVSNQYGVMSLPTLLIFKKGELVNSLVGAATKAAIKNMVAAANASGGTA